MLDALIQWLHRIGLHADPALADAANEAGLQASRALSGMDLPALLALAGALGWASGLRLYAVVFLVGAMGAADWVVLPGGLQLLQHPVVLAASGFMLVVEFFADKLPWFDSLWDGVHSVIRIPGGALLAAGVFGGDSAVWGLAAGLLGGSLAATAFATKASTRAAANTSPEPFSNVGLSLVEDAAVPAGLWLALAHPLVFLVLLLAVLAFSVWLICKCWRFLRAFVARVAGLFGARPGSPGTSGQ